MNLSVLKLINSNVAAFHEEGLRVYDAVAERLMAGEEVTISFAGIQRCATQFLHALMGKLYQHFATAEIERRVHFDFDGNERTAQKADEVKWRAANASTYNDIITQATGS